MAHVGEKIRACLSHVQRGLSRDFQFPIGRRQASVDGFQLGGTRRDDMLQLAEVVGQPVFRGASLLDFNGHGLDVLVGDLDQYADFVIFMV
ncbi:hypothetical protein D3C86_1892740 [compost metagenome]